MTSFSRNEPTPREALDHFATPRSDTCYTIFVDETASRSSDTIDAAKELAAPYIGLGRHLKIERHDPIPSRRAWIYDYNRYEWVEQAPDGSMAGERSARRG